MLFDIGTGILNSNNPPGNNGKETKQTSRNF